MGLKPKSKVSRMFQIHSIDFRNNKGFRLKLSLDGKVQDCLETVSFNQNIIYK